MKKLRRLGTRSYLAAGLSALLVTLALAASYLGLIPDREALARAHRGALAETIALSASALVNQTPRPWSAADPTAELGAQLAALEPTLRAIAQRNPELRSIGVRDAAGQLLLDLAEEPGGHAAGWRLQPGEPSTEQAVQIPISRWRMTDAAQGDEAAEPWGQMELRFAPLRREGWLSYLDDPTLRLMAFLSVGGFILFSLYLRRMLRHLDPSRAIPQRVRHALDTLTEGLLVLDARGLMVLANQSLARIVGTDADDMLGRSAAHLPWCDRDGLLLPKDDLPWLEVLRTGELRRNVLMYLEQPADPARGPGSDARPAPVRYTFRVNCSPILGGSGQAAQGVLVSFQDVTELEEKELALQAAKERADAANRAKSDFLASMSHEIRTPMNAILGFTEVLRRGGQGQRSLAEQRKHLDIIHASGNHLLQLINDILDLSKVESGHFEIERLQFSPHEVIQEVLQILAVKAQEKGLALRADYPGPLPATIQTDPGRLRQILTNLVGNAIKFTESGSVAVGARAERRRGGWRFIIEVTDTGIGIPPDRLGQVFEPFVQAEASTTRRFGGTGLGLTISRRFAQAMGGDITVSSRWSADGQVPGRGSTFRVEIDPGPLEGVPLVDPAGLAGPRSPQPSGQVRWRFPAVRVLVVDDGAENRELARVVLEEAGITVVEAEDGEAAVRLATAAGQPGFDLILMDMQMPVMDGVTATRTLRERGWSGPIIALTANAMKGFEREIEQAGFSGFQTKPIHIDRLLQDLAHRLGGTVATEVLAAPAAPLAPDLPQLKPPGAPADNSPNPPQPDTRPIVSRLAHHPKLQNVARKFVTQLPDKLAAMDAALAAGRLDELGDLAHWLKGAGGSVGFDECFEPARDLEAAARGADAAAAARELTRIHALGRRLTADPAPGEGALPS
jgi:signal transduction histidine kinase/DNA-binding NarL/FixJ family response regulator/HPt (histidine-containing phosphotransfer) domain-containing protein